MHLALPSAGDISLSDIAKYRHAHSRYQQHVSITNHLERGDTQRTSVVWNIESYNSYR
jgi:hypothetical protein